MSELSIIEIKDSDKPQFKLKVEFSDDSIIHFGKQGQEIDVVKFLKKNKKILTSKKINLKHKKILELYLIQQNFSMNQAKKYFNRSVIPGLLKENGRVKSMPSIKLPGKKYLEFALEHDIPPFIKASVKSLPNSGKENFQVALDTLPEVKDPDQLPKEVNVV